MNEKITNFVIFFILITLFIFNKSTTVFAKNLMENNISQKVMQNSLAEKYCDSVSKNLFKGLDNEEILKYEYFFSSIPENSIQNNTKFIDILRSKVQLLCSYEFSESDEKEFNYFYKNYFKIKSNTPKISVEEINPSPTNPAIIPVLR